MTEPVSLIEPSEATDTDDRFLASGKNVTGLRGLANLRSACMTVHTFGTGAGWGLVVLGLVLGLLHLLEGPGNGPHGLVAWTRTGLESAVVALAFVIAGWGLAAILTLTAAAVREHFERAAGDSDRLSTQAARGLEFLERIAAAMELRPAIATVVPASGLERSRAMAQIVGATQAADWVEATERLKEFEDAFPEDPELPALREELANARHSRRTASLAQLDAARAANDPDGVLEIYQSAALSLDGPERTALEQDLGKWFLGLIHRRLRTGKVQSDVVQLAGRFAETFAATVEGASVRASLPTLRRSVGLCPKCAQPYTGVADACPQCKKAGGVVAATALPPEEMNSPE